MIVYLAIFAAGFAMGMVYTIFVFLLSKNRRR